MSVSKKTIKQKQVIEAKIIQMRKIPKIEDRNLLHEHKLNNYDINES